MTSMPDYVEFDPDGDVVLLLKKQGKIRGQGTENADLKSASGAVSPAVVSDGTPPDEVRMRVSSSHLALASPIFKCLLKGNFAESRSLSSRGTAEVLLPEDDAQALQILLNIVHGHLKKVPRTIEFGMLTNVSVLIDKYCLHEVTTLFTDMWFSKLNGDIPKSFTEDLMSWLCISWVLRKSETFRETTKIAMQESEGQLGGSTSLDLPIPASVIDRIEKARQSAISECLTIIGAIQANYESPAKQCRQQEDCDAMVLGGLCKALVYRGLQPLPSSPFIGLSFKDLQCHLSQMSLPSLCKYLRTCGKRPYQDDHVNCSACKNCGIKNRIDHSLSYVSHRLQGLELD